VDKRSKADPRVQDLEARMAEASASEKARLGAELRALRRAVHSEKLGEVATEFDGVHSVERARDVGSVHEIIPAARLRPHLVAAVESGMQKERDRLAGKASG
jgi:hypothetical protein